MCPYSLKSTFNHRFVYPHGSGNATKRSLKRPHGSGATVLPTKSALLDMRQGIWCTKFVLPALDERILPTKFVHPVSRQGICCTKFVLPALDEGILSARFAHPASRQGICCAKFIRPPMHERILPAKSVHICSRQGVARAGLVHFGRGLEMAGGKVGLRSCRGGWLFRMEKMHVFFKCCFC